MKKDSGIIIQLASSLKASEELYQSIKGEEASGTKENLDSNKGINSGVQLSIWDDGNTLIKGNNLDILKNEERMEKLSLIYIDPPFFTGADKKANIRVEDNFVPEDAYADSWNNLEEYCKMLCVRLMLMRDALAEDGLIFVHVDWHAVHYIRILLDEIFGYDRFVNEIIWQYKSGGSTNKRFARKHDNILVYSKSSKYKFYPQKEKSYNRGLKPYRFKGVEEFQDEVGWYTMVNMKDVWSIDMVGRTSSERTGYATQKPEQLMRRIIECCTEEGDLVGDFFCGSGSFGVAAAKLNRRFVMSDMGDLAIDITRDRLDELGVLYRYLEE